MGFAGLWWKLVPQRVLIQNEQDSFKFMVASVIRHNVIPTLLYAVVIFYLCFHVIHGEQGLYALLVENHRQERLHAEWEGLRQKRLFMEHKVARMRDDSLDPDLLDEEARRFLGVAKKGEWILLTPP